MGISYRDFDVQTVLAKQCNLPEQGTVDSALQDFLFGRWACLKAVFRRHFDLPWEKVPVHLRPMLRHLSLPFPDQVSSADRGERNLCLGDAFDTARIIQALLKADWKPRFTAQRTETTQGAVGSDDMAVNAPSADGSSHKAQAGTFAKRPRMSNTSSADNSAKRARASSMACDDQSALRAGVLNAAPMKQPAHMLPAYLRPRPQTLEQG